jgi:hypothetical protein
MMVEDDDIDAGRIQPADALTEVDPQSIAMSTCG